MPTFLTKAEVADMLRCSTRHIERLIGEGLPFIPIGARKKLFCAESVSRWLLARESCIRQDAAKLRSRPPEPLNAYTAYFEEVAAKRRAREEKRLAKAGAKGSES